MEGKLPLVMRPQSKNQKDQELTVYKSCPLSLPITTFTLESSIGSINFHDLYIKIVNASKNQGLIRSHYNFGKALKDHLGYYKTNHLKQTAKVFVNDRVRNQLA